VSSIPIFDFDFDISITHILCVSLPYFKFYFHVEGTQTAVTASIPTASVLNTTAASVAPTAIPDTATVTVPNTAAVSVVSVSIPNTASASVPNTTAASDPNTTAASVPNTAVPVKPSEFALDPEKAREFFDATDDKSIPLADFLRQLQMTEKIYGDDTDMINSLTSNTSKHEKEKLKVCCDTCLIL
jgi:hypothetical protein